MNFAIIGASGNVGRKTIEILEKSKIQFEELYLVASKKSAGKKIVFKGKELKIENLNDYDFSKAQITFFAAGSQIAKEWKVQGLEGGYELASREGQCRSLQRHRHNERLTF